MNVIRLRTHYGIPALKGENNWCASDPDTSIRMLPNGHFVVSKYHKHVLIPGAALVSADVEPGERAVSEPAEDVVKRSPGRPRKEAQA